MAFLKGAALAAGRVTVLVAGFIFLSLGLSFPTGAEAAEAAANAG